MNVTIQFDPDSWDPRRDDPSNVTKIVNFHPRYSVGDVNLRHDGYKAPRDDIRMAKLGLSRNIWMYDHSGLLFNLDRPRESWPYARWDAMCIGYITIDPAAALACYGRKRFTRKFIATLMDRLVTEFNAWSAYCSGDCYLVWSAPEDPDDSELLFGGPYDACRKFVAENRDYVLVEEAQ